MALPIAGYGQGRRRLNVGAVGGGSNVGLQLLMQLINQDQGGFNEARQANESRYADILKLFGDNRQRTLGLLDNFGKSLTDDANRSYDDKRKELLTDLADRGLASSTARIGVETGVKRERDAELNRIKDMLTENYTNADLGFTDRAAGVMERREDPYPDNSANMGLIAQLVNSIAASNGGGRAVPEWKQRQQNSQMLRSIAAATGAAAPPQPVNDFEGMRQDSAEQAQRDQQRDMLGLFLAESPNTGTYIGDKERAALSQMIANGTAQFNPAKVGAAVVDTTPRSPIPYLPTGGGRMSYGGGEPVGGYGKGYSYNLRKSDRQKAVAVMKANRNNPSARWQPGAGQRQGANLLAGAAKGAAGAMAALAALGGVSASDTRAPLAAIQPTTPAMPAPQSQPPYYWDSAPVAAPKPLSPFSGALYAWMDQMGIRRPESNIGPQPYNAIPGAQSFGWRDPVTGLGVFDQINNYYRY